jgi:hypothetical protein
MALRLRSIPVFMLAMAGSAAVTVACGDDKGSGEEHGDVPQACQEIINACHDADTGSGMAHECHEQAEQDGTEETCEMIHDACLAACAGGTGTETGTSLTTMSSTTDSESGTEEEGTTHAHDESTGHQDESSSGDDHGTGETGASSCDLIGSGCHDDKTAEGIACHDIGHGGDVAACDEALDMCAKICGF